MTSQKPKIVVVVGPTASGKTSLSIELAKKFNGEVISADSRQVYQQLNIGTEKVTKDEMQSIPHYLLDIADVNTVYTAANFKKDATAAVYTILKRNRLPIVAGGTFFYIDVLLEEIHTPEVPPNKALRTKLQKEDISELFSLLQKQDPQRAASIDPHNKRRLIRALEITDVVQAVPINQKPDCPYDVLKIGIKTQKDELRSRIRSRAKQAVSRGLIEETQQLLKSGISKERLSEIGLEYRVAMEYLDGIITKKELIQKLEEKNWQYAKRQLTWLKRDHTINWFELSDRNNIYQCVEDFLYP